MVNLFQEMTFFQLAGNGLGYEQLRGLTLTFASTRQAENPRGFSEVGRNKQLLIAIVSNRFSYPLSLFVSP
ncbi:hypothetical protein QO206_15215 [Leeuwenhoekiella aequorea]|uniref:hypothetical protein n=1 Tax=Leeuwenhoekiella aequorea TaxID=283736 RepID=UPI00352F55B1